MQTLEFIPVTLQAGNFVAIIMLRDNLTKYPNCPYMVRTKKLTPKGKYQKEIILKQIVFKTELEAEIYAKKYIGNIQNSIDSKEQEANRLKAANSIVKASDFYKIDDIVVNTWGYEQTNVDFYKVVKVGNKTIKVVSVLASVVEGSEGFMCCDLMPTLNESKESEGFNLRVYENGRLSNPASYYYFRKWDGKAQYNSWYA